MPAGDLIHRGGSRGALAALALSLTLTPAATPSPAGARDFPAPYAHGEELVFEVSWMGIVAGSATMRVDPPSPFRGFRAYRFTSRATSSPFFSRIFPVDDRISSWAEATTLGSLRFEQSLREGRRSRDQVIDFDPLRQVAISGEEQVTTPPGVHDSLSAFYHLRTLDLPTGTSHTLDVHSGGKNYRLRVDVLARERIRTPFGERAAIKIEPHQEYEGVFDQRGRVLIWLSDDRSRLPLLMRSSLTIGSIVARLVEYRIQTSPPESATTPQASSN